MNLWLGLVLTAVLFQHGSIANLQAQNVTARFNNLTIYDGLSYNAVYDVLQDRMGFMWFATGDGLNKYDGNRFTIYKRIAGDSTSLSDSWITTLFEDAEGLLWIGTRNGGINIFDRELEGFYRHSLTPGDVSEQVWNDWIECFFQDRKGNIWVGTTEQGLVRIDNKTGDITQYLHDPLDDGSLSSNSVMAIAEDDTGMLWVGTWDKGLNRFNPEEETFQCYIYDERQVGSIRSDRIRALLVDREGTLWIGTSGGGLNKYDRSTDSFVQYAHDINDPNSLSDNKVWALSEDSLDRLWVGSLGGGLHRFDSETEQFFRIQHRKEDPYSLSDNSVTAIHEDRSGILWIATGEGLSQYDPGQEYFRLFSQELDSSGEACSGRILDIHEIPAIHDKLWIGTDGSGLCSLNRQAGLFSTYNNLEGDSRNLSQNVVSSVVHDASGSLWIGTKGGGLKHFDPVTEQFFQYRHDPDDKKSLCHDVITTLFIDHADQLWIGSDGNGLDRFDRTTGTFKHFVSDPNDLETLSDNNITTISEDRNGHLWIGTTDEGLNRFDPQTESFKNYKHNSRDPGSLIHNRVVSIYEDEQGKLWLGTLGGLDRFNPRTEEFEHINIRDGSQSNYIHDVTGDKEGSVWIRTTKGLSHLDLTSGLFRHFYNHQNLGGNEYITGTLMYSSTGDLYMGSNRGVVNFTPHSSLISGSPSPLVISSFRVLDVEVKSEIVSGDTVMISYRDDFFSLDFVLLDYVDPEKHTYQYILTDFDNDWREAKGSIGSVSYSNPRSQTGDFPFQVRGSSGNGQWSDVSVLFRILPPWWQRIWFRILSSLGLIGLIYAVVSYQLSKRQKVRLETRQLLTERRERERQRLARELHDRPLQELYAICHRLQKLIAFQREDENKEVLVATEAALGETAEELRFLCSELRPPMLEHFGLAKAIRSHGRTIERMHDGITIHYDLASDAQALPENTRLVLFRVYQSALGNITRHSQAQNAWITFIVEKEKAMIEIRDDGCGFTVPKDWLELAREKHFGLLGMKEWVESISGLLTVRSTPGRGTMLRVVAPMEIKTNSNYIRLLIQKYILHRTNNFTMMK